MKSRNVKVAYAIAVVLATAAAIVAVLTLGATRTSQYHDLVITRSYCPPQVMCPDILELPGFDYTSFEYDVALAAVISITLTGTFLLLALVRRRALFPVASTLSFSVIAVALMDNEANDAVLIGELANRVLLATLIGCGIVLTGAVVAFTTGRASKRVSGSTALLAFLVALDAIAPCLLVRLAFASY